MQRRFSSENFRFCLLGIINRLDPKRKQEEGPSLELRLKRLSSLQSRLVEHAATFPSVERIVIFKRKLVSYVIVIYVFMYRYILLARFMKKRMKLLLDKFFQKSATRFVWMKHCLGGRDEEQTVMTTHRMT